MSGAKNDSLQRLVRRWDDWPKEELATEICDRMRHFYGQTNGTMKFPSSAEGDLLKMVHVLLSPNNRSATSCETLTKQESEGPYVDS